MDVKGELAKRIEKERQKVNNLRIELSRCEAFAQGLQEALNMLEGTRERKNSSTPTPIGFRAGDVKNTYELLKTAGKPLHIGDILTGIGKENTRGNRASLASSLYRSVRKGGLIKKVGSNMFSVEESTEAESSEPKELLNLPESFGHDASP